MLTVERIDEHKDAEEPEEVDEELGAGAMRCGFHNSFLYSILKRTDIRNYDFGHVLKK